MSSLVKIVRIRVRVHEKKDLLIYTCHLFLLTPRYRRGNPLAPSNASLPTTKTDLALIPPIIQHQTHILVLFGPTNTTHMMDGWMWADFCFLNQMLRGLGDHRFTSLSPDTVLRRRGDILFGNPHRTRKVVYSQDTPMAHIHQVSGWQQDLKDEFLWQVRLRTELAELGDMMS
ncbi:hypothetical protein BGX38DRAFT_460542 [Terfezia claveryi]|nr:hypothetical protein BGX38DRAFT_460542 [Terfezia claveryi]